MTWLNDATIKTAADKQAEAAEQARQQAKAERDSALNSMAYTFADGRTIQTRPSDLIWLQGGIEKGGDDWVLADNTVAFVTDAELIEAVDWAKTEAARIFTAYKGKL